jgi:DNA-binding transcriptional MerR regulator
MVGNDAGEFWTIEELGARVEEALAGYGGVPSGRVRDVPDPRTIRYYTTLGLLDRPAGVRGRTVLYGPRHLRQLVAIKRLQARGLSLGEIQQQVAGASDGALTRLAGPLGVAREQTAIVSPRSERSRSSRFWRDSPAPARADAAVAESTEPPLLHEAEDQSEPEDTFPAVVAMQAARLGEGLTLLIGTRRPIDDEDLRVIRMAAAPMIELLKLRGLIGPGDGENPGRKTTRAREER